MGNPLRATYFALLVVAVFILGTLGYASIEGWNLFDAAYMTVITLTTTGYSEVHDLSVPGRSFTMVLLLVGASLITFGIKQLVEVQLIDPEKRWRKKMFARIQKLKNHVVVCGYGRMGKVICDELKKNNTPFIVLEKHPDRLEELKLTDFIWLKADASDDNDLIEANIESARVLIVAVDNDSDVLYTLVGAKNINPNIFAICRASTETAKNRLIRIGANKVVLPMTASAIVVAHTALNPELEDILDITNNSIFGEGSLSIVQFAIHGVRNFDEVSRFAEQEDIVVVGIKGHLSGFTFAPKAGLVLNEGDQVLAICPVDKSTEVQKKFYAQLTH